MLTTITDREMALRLAKALALVLEACGTHGRHGRTPPMYGDHEMGRSAVVHWVEGEEERELVVAVGADPVHVLAEFVERAARGRLAEIYNQVMGDFTLAVVAKMLVARLRAREDGEDDGRTMRKERLAALIVNEVAMLVGRP